MTRDLGSREAMVEAVSQYRMVVLKLRSRRMAWDKCKPRVLAALNEYQDAVGAATREVPGFEGMEETEQAMALGADVWARGQAAHTECEANHKQTAALQHMRHGALLKALEAVGAYHGKQMSSDGTICFQHRYWKEARRMATTVRSLMPWSRIIGPGADFATTKGWAKALGMRNAQELLNALGEDGMARLA